MVRILKEKCPRCGYVLSSTFNSSAKIEELLKKRSPTTRKLLRTVSKKIMTNIPTDNKRSRLRYFLLSIEDCEDKVVEWGLTQYALKEYMYQGKGFPFLKAIILNFNQNKEGIAKFERKRLGKSPTATKLKGGDT